MHFFPSIVWHGGFFMVNLSNLKIIAMKFIYELNRCDLLLILEI